MVSQFCWFGGTRIAKGSATFSPNLMIPASYFRNFSVNQNRSPELSTRPATKDKISTSGILTELLLRCCTQIFLCKLPKNIIFRYYKLQIRGFFRAERTRAERVIKAWFPYDRFDRPDRPQNVGRSGQSYGNTVVDQDDRSDCHRKDHPGSISDDPGDRRDRNFLMEIIPADRGYPKVPLVDP